MSEADTELPRPGETAATVETHILLISGSLRAGSTNTAVLRTAQLVAPAGVKTSLYEEMRALPHFDPDDDAEGRPVHPAVARLRAAVNAADALLFCTPEYASALPGAFKNLLEWTIGDASTYDKPVASINAASSPAPNAAFDAHDSLRKVLGTVHARVIEPAWSRIPVARSDLNADGTIDDPAIRARIRVTLESLAAGARSGLGTREDG